MIVDLGDAASSAAFRAVWPMAKMPVLRDEARGCTVAESTIVIEYLDASLPGRDPVRASGPRRRLADADVGPLLRPLRPGADAEDRDRPAASGGQNDAHGVAQAQAQLREAYAVLEQEIAAKTWMMGDAFTLADCAAAPALFYADTVVPIGPTQPRLAAYLDRLMARPSFARVLEEAEPYFELFPMERKPQLGRRG